ncbi:MAG TPA: dTDP-4-dehydrorhamnose reductase [Acidimicrobiales bacterium]|nr:dTDP-4-dehydrorhamnose reductase [Acidimicrobiales bacterium]
MKVVVTGAHGQLGRELVTALADREVIAASRAELDVTDRDAVLQMLTTINPDVVVHAATYTDVDGCEIDPARAFGVNAAGTRHVAEGARRTGAHLVCFSTDHVFDGRLDRPYHEWDDTNPASVYGRSKLAGEREAVAAVPGCTIVRTSWLSGRHGSNIVKTILRVASERDELAFVDDQHGCPTFADDLAAMAVRLVATRAPGVFHVTNQGATTWHQLACDVLVAAGLDPARVRPIKTAELEPARPAPRPANSVLDNAALAALGYDLLPDHHEPLERLVKELIA